MLTFLAATPVPRDLPLPLPVPEWVLVACLIVFFLVHILFVNLMVGSSLFVAVLEGLGRRNKRWDDLAHAVAETISVNKSLAVVMGIGPLLCINLLYTIQWYSANALTGHAWLLIIPLVTLAFLLTYLHKYTWEKWSTGGRKALHQAVGITAAGLFLCIPLIFLANVNLMLFPSEWEKVKGFFSSLSIGNVLPRYLHFMAACIAITGLFLAGWLGRRKADLTHLPEFTRPELRRIFYKVCAYVTLGQFLLGPLLLFTLPAVGLTVGVYGFIISGAVMGVMTLLVLFSDIKQDDSQIGSRYWLIVAMFSIVVLGMGSGRHAYREAALAGHKQAVRDRTVAYATALEEFKHRAASAAPVA